VTHDELLKKIYSMELRYANEKPRREALRAVVELHKPDSTGGCNACEEWTNEGPYQLPYPCRTIEAIEKELV